MIESRDHGDSCCLADRLISDAVFVLFLYLELYIQSGLDSAKEK